jgi:hypothetical protein
VRLGTTLGANKTFGLRWTFGKSGTPIALSPGQTLGITCRDLHTGLLTHTAMVQGYK